jgi:AcrR family transcriptional regulator
MSTKPFRPRRSHSDSRSHILAAALQLLAEKGVERLKLTEVATAAGVSHPTVLHHFGSIGELHAALMEKMIHDLVAKVMPDGGLRNFGTDQLIGLNALFETFESPAAARLAAWLEITGEHRKLESLGKTFKTVVSERMAPAGWDSTKAEELVLLAATLALGVGLFGNALGDHLGRPTGWAKELALRLLAQEVERQRPSRAP